MNELGRMGQEAVVVRSRYLQSLAGKTEKTMKTLRIAGVPAEIRT
jgi:hypothetical protein